MKRITQATDILGVLERGDLNHDLTGEIESVLKALRDLAPPKGKVKGSVGLTLNFQVEGQSVEIEASITSKVPKRQRGRSFYFLTQEGSLSTEHPQQSDMFNGPRAVASSDH
jgi:hypothetical protein